MKYIFTYIASFIGVIFCVAMLNWFVDPFGMYWSPTIQGINQIKPSAGTRTRITKAYRVDSIKPQVLIVGNSRVEMGLNPEHKIFEGKRVYNQGMPGASIKMQIDYAIEAINNQADLEYLLVSVDFLDFLMSAKEISLFNKGINKPANYNFRLTSQDKGKVLPLYERFNEKVSLILSLDALTSSVKTLAQQNTTASTINVKGFNSAGSYIEIIDAESIKPLFVQKLDEISQLLNKTSWQILAHKTFPYSPNFEQLGHLIKKANNKNIKVTFFINPYHFSYLHTIADNKHWQNFQQWKLTLVRYLSQIQQDEIDLWDFSTFSAFVNEPVPFAKPKQKMNWYWEPAHYRKELGDIMLENMLVGTKTQKFGIQLTTDNIQGVIRKQQIALADTTHAWKKLYKALH